LFVATTRPGGRAAVDVAGRAAAAAPATGAGITPEAVITALSLSMADDAESLAMVV
jgi:hypothetical protein